MRSISTMYMISQTEGIKLGQLNACESDERRRNIQ